jgi:hypothetical protein
MISGYLLSDNDTAIVGIDESGRWPAFAAGITFELFRRLEPPNGRSYLQAILGGLSWKRPEKTSEYCRLPGPPLYHRF